MHCIFAREQVLGGGVMNSYDTLILEYHEAFSDAVQISMPYDIVYALISDF